MIDLVSFCELFRIKENFVLKLKLSWWQVGCLQSKLSQLDFIFKWMSTFYQYFKRETSIFLKYDMFWFKNHVVSNFNFTLACFSYLTQLQYFAFLAICLFSHNELSTIYFCLVTSTLPQPVGGRGKRLWRWMFCF